MKFCRCCGFLPCRGAPAEVEASWGDAQEVREAHLEPTYVSPYSDPTARAAVVLEVRHPRPRDWRYDGPRPSRRQRPVAMSVLEWARQTREITIGELAQLQETRRREFAVTALGERHARTCRPHFDPLEPSFRTLRADRCPLVSDSCPREDHVHDPNNGGWVPLHPGEGFRVFAIFEPMQPPAPRIVGCIGCGAVAQRCNPLCPAQGAARMPEDPYAATASHILERQRAMAMDQPIPESVMQELMAPFLPEPIRADTRPFQADFAAVERRLAAMMGCGPELATRPSWSELETRIAATLRETADLHSGCEDAPNGEDSP